jgi:hypothetical protein
MTSNNNNPTPTEHSCCYLPKRGFAWHVSGLLAFTFGIAVWIGFLAVPRANPWMMGEVAFTRLLILNGVMLAGSIGAVLLTAIGWHRLHSRWLLFASFPCLLYVIVIIVLFLR